MKQGRLLYGSDVYKLDFPFGQVQCMQMCSIAPPPPPRPPKKKKEGYSLKNESTYFYSPKGILLIHTYYFNEYGVEYHLSK